MVNKTNMLKKIWWIILVGLFMATIVMFIIAPEYPTFNYSCLGLSFVICLVLCFVDRGIILSFARSSFGKNVFAQFVQFLLVVSIIGLINYLGFKNDKSYDLTENKIFALSDQSKRIVSQFNNKVK